MKTQGKSKDKLLEELEKSNQRISELEKCEIEHIQVETLISKLSNLKEQLIATGSLSEKLKLITDDVVDIFDADFARIWMINEGDLCEKGCIHANVTEGPHVCHDRNRCLHLMASSGRYTHIDGDHRRVPFGCYKIGRVASSEYPKFITKDVTHDPQVHDHEWARKLGLVSFAGFRLLSPEGKPIGVLALFTQHVIDFEEEKLLEDLAHTTSYVIMAGESEKAILESEAKYRAIFENSGTPMLFIDESMFISLINKECEKLSGYSKDEVEGKMKWTEIVANKDDLGRMIEYHRLRRIDPAAAPPTYEFQFLDKKGQIKDVIATVSMIPGTKKRLAALLDITERKHAERALQKSEEKFRSVIEQSYDGFALFNEEGQIIEWNRAQERITGLKKEDVLGSFMWDVTFQLVPEKRKTRELIEMMKKGMGEISMTGKISGRIMEHEMEIQQPDGTYRIVEIVKFPIRADKGFMSSSITRDVTERKQAEVALKESEENFRAIAENASEGILIAVGKGIHVYANQMAAETTGYTIEELVGKNIGDLAHPDEINRLMERYKVRITGKPVPPTYETRIVRKDDKVVPIEFTAAKTVWKGQSADMVIIRDISQRKKAEKDLKQSLEEKEMLLREIHHRVKNNLMIISSLLNLQSKYIKDKEALDIFKESQSRARSMAIIHERLYQSTDLKRIDFGDYIRTLTMELFRTYRGDPDRVKMNMDVENLEIDINTTVPLGLIVNELVSNSLKHAFPDGKKGEINVYFHKIDDEFILKVCDNGVGVPGDLDFRNTDSLGLQIVNSLAGQIDATIELDTSKGTDFEIRFKEEEL